MLAAERAVTRRAWSRNHRSADDAAKEAHDKAEQHDHERAARRAANN